MIPAAVWFGEHLWSSMKSEDDTRCLSSDFAECHGVFADCRFFK